MGMDAAQENSRDALTGRDISARFGRGKNWWSDNHEDFVKTRNFPPALPGAGRKRWSRRQVERWFETGGRSYDPPQPSEPRDDAAFARRLADYETNNRKGATP
jgi:hypothetical protein